MHSHFLFQPPILHLKARFHLLSMSLCLCGAGIVRAVKERPLKESIYWLQSCMHIKGTGLTNKS